MNIHSSFLMKAIIGTTLMYSGASLAATVNGTLGVTAIVGAGCQVNSGTVDAGNINFGNLNFGSINTIGGANIDAQTTGSGNGSITMECSDGTPFSVTLDDGLILSAARARWLIAAILHRFSLTSYIKTPQEQFPGRLVHR